MPLFSALAKLGVRVINEKLNLCMLSVYYSLFHLPGGKNILCVHESNYDFIYIVLDLKWIIRANDSWSANKSSNISTPETCPQKIFHSCNYPNTTSTKKLIPTVAPMWATRTSTHAATPRSAQSNKTKQVCLERKERFCT